MTVLKKIQLLSILLICFFTMTNCKQTKEDTIITNGHNFLFQYGGENNDEGLSVHIDKSGNSYVGGYYSQVGKTINDSIQLEFPMSVGKSAMIQKTDSEGAIVWQKFLLGQTEVAKTDINNIYTDSKNNIYLSGNFNGTVDFDPSAKSTLITGTGTDGYLLKLSPLGELLWVNQDGSPGFDNAHSIVVDENDYLYTTAEFMDTIQLNGLNNEKINLINTASLTSPNVFIQKLNNKGQTIWAKVLNTSIMSQGVGLCLDKKGNLYNSGFFIGKADFNPGKKENYINSVSEDQLDIYVLKLTNNGDFVWVNTIGGVGNEMTFTVAVDTKQNAYISGNFSDSLIIKELGNKKIKSKGLQDFFISKIDNKGKIEWFKSLGSGGQENGREIAIDSDNDLFITGFYSNTLEIKSPNYTKTLISKGNIDMFLLKMNSDGDYIWANRYGGEGNESGWSIDVDNTHLYLTGFFSNTIEFNHLKEKKVLDSNGELDFFFTKFQKNKFQK